MGDMDDGDQDFFEAGDLDQQFGLNGELLMKGNIYVPGGEQGRMDFSFLEDGLDGGDRRRKEQLTAQMVSPLQED